MRLIQVQWLKGSNFDLNIFNRSIQSCFCGLKSVATGYIDVTNGTDKAIVMKYASEMISGIFYVLHRYDDFIYVCKQ